MSQTNDPLKNKSTSAPLILGLLIVLGIFVMAFFIVQGGQELTGFQTFVTVVLGAIFTGIGGLIIKIQADRNKSLVQASEQAEKQRQYEERQEEAQRRHEETLEKIRLQTNGRLHKRDEQIEDYARLVHKLFKRIDELMVAQAQVAQNVAETAAITVVEKLDAVESHNKDSIEELRASIENRQDELNTNLKPFFDKDK